MSAPARPTAVAIWEETTIGQLTIIGSDGREEASAVFDSRTVMFSDDSWVRSGHDPFNPLAATVEEGEAGADEILTRICRFISLRQSVGIS